MTQSCNEDLIVPLGSTIILRVVRSCCELFRLETDANLHGTLGDELRTPFFHIKIRLPDETSQVP